MSGSKVVLALVAMGFLVLGFGLGLLSFYGIAPLLGVVVIATFKQVMLISLYFSVAFTSLVGIVLFPFIHEVLSAIEKGEE